MSNNEGEILRKIVKASDMQVQEFADKLGMTRQNLNYLFKKRRIGEDNKEKLALLLNRSINELFDNQNDKSELSSDSEKETLKDLVKTQKSLIKYQNEFIIAQLIRNEAFESVILARMAEIEIATVPSRKNSTLDAVLDEAELDVKEKIQEIRDRLRLPS